MIKISYNLNILRNTDKRIFLLNRFEILHVKCVQIDLEQSG